MNAQQIGGATSRPWLLAWARAATTSVNDRHRAMTAGRLSIIALHRLVVPVVASPVLAGPQLAVLLVALEQDRSIGAAEAGPRPADALGVHVLGLRLNAVMIDPANLLGKELEWPLQERCAISAGTHVVDRLGDDCVAQVVAADRVA
jgi:hypothetical protein